MLTPTPLHEAMARLRRYIDMRQKQPLRGMDDRLHCIHTGTPWEAELRLSDLTLLAAAVEGKLPSPEGFKIGKGEAA